MRITIAFCFVIFLSVGYCHAQKIVVSDNCVKEYDSLTRMLVYTYPEEEPNFQQLQEYIVKNFHPSVKEDIQSSFDVELIIDTKGRVKAARVVGKKQDELTPAEKSLVTLLSDRKGLKPGKCKGKKVAVKMVLPIHIHPR